MKLADCGHPSTPDGLGIGYATDPNTGKTLCYSCADVHQREWMNTHDVISGYVSQDSERVTTWTGGLLARIAVADRRQRGIRQYTPSGGYWTRYAWHVEDLQGAWWYGINAGPGMSVTLRRMRKPY